MTYGFCCRLRDVFFFNRGRVYAGLVEAVMEFLLWLGELRFILLRKYDVLQTTRFAESCLKPSKCLKNPVSRSNVEEDGENFGKTVTIAEALTSAAFVDIVKHIWSEKRKSMNPRSSLSSGFYKSASMILIYKKRTFAKMHDGGVQTSLRIPRFCQ